MTETIQQEQLIEQKALPFPAEKGWTGIPNSIFTVYMKHPQMNTTAVTVYGLLLRYRNHKYGYAYPSQVDLAIDLGVSTGTIGNAVKRLVAVGLIRVVYNMRHSNNNYFFETPVETIEEFEEKFPEIKDHLRKLEKQAEEIRAEAEADKQRLRESRAR